MSYNQIAAKLKNHTPVDCDNCPYNWSNPEEACIMGNCLEYYFVLGYKEALSDMKVPKTLAENRDD